MGSVSAYLTAASGGAPARKLGPTNVSLAADFNKLNVGCARHSSSKLDSALACTTIRRRRDDGWLLGCAANMSKDVSFNPSSTPQAQRALRRGDDKHIGLL